MVNTLTQNLIQRASQNYQPQVISKPENSVRQQAQASPLDPKGHLITKGYARSESTYKTYAHSAKDFYKALTKGEGNDYTVGKINDPAIKLGSLGIAAAIASKAASPTMKSMEFLGFATWFAAMSIWPKAFLAKPVKSLYGFDPNQQYVDSFGRKKRFFEDPQYLPWDLWSDKEISKIGDKLNIPKDVQNRREATQNKMKQIATQYNTLWMITAGFATPILSSLMGDALSRPVSKFINRTRVKLSAPEYAKALSNTASNSKLSAKSIANAYADFTSGVAAKAIDLFNIKKEPSMIPAVSEEKINDLKSILSSGSLKENDAQTLQGNVREFFEQNLGINKPGFKNEVNETIANLFTENKSSHIGLQDSVVDYYKKAHEVANSFKITGSKFERATDVVLGKGADTSISDIWLDMPKKISNILELDSAHMKNMLNLKDTTGEKHIAAIVDHINLLASEKNSKKYDKVVDRLINTISETMEKLDAADNTFGIQNISIDEYKKNHGITKELDEAEEAEIKEKINREGLDKLEAKLFKNISKTDADKQSLMDKLALDISKETTLRTQNTRNTLYNVLNVLDIAKNHRDGIDLNKAIKGINVDELYHGPQEETYMAAKALWSGEMSKDMMNKLGSLKDNFAVSMKDNLERATRILEDRNNGKDNILMANNIGKSLLDTVEEGVSEIGKHGGWLTKVSVIGGVILAGTMIAISNFGKSNQYNLDNYTSSQGGTKA